MVRMYDVHIIRHQRELGGIWKMETLSYNGDTIKKYDAVVPSCWESMRGLEDYRGRCRYTKKFFTESGNLRIEFKGVSHTADVYFDRQHIAHHYNAYTPFDVLIKNCERGEHILEVIVDNRFSENSALHIPNDYRSYGGITRPVVLENLDKAYIRFVHATPIRLHNGWSLEVEANIQKISDYDGGISFELKVAGQSLTENNIKFDNEGICRINHVFNFDDVSEWSPESPNLYTAYANLYNENGVFDDLNERFGFRDIKTDGKKIILNGKVLHIKGFNRHEEYGTIGCAVSEGIINQDVDIILSTGANLIRTCHYPNDERFLDICDERGVLVWEEAHARQLKAKDMLNPNFRKQTADCIEEMIRNHYNHPSIIFWGIMNECDSTDEYGRECYKAQYDQIKSLDASRLTTSATNKHLSDMCYDLPDVISVNIYPRWYVNDTPMNYLNRIKNHIREEVGAEKPLLISECGAGAIYGYRAFNNVKWSEDRQANILRELITEYSADRDVSGVIIWQFADCRVDDEFFSDRPKTQNNKGIVDIYRQPKLSYYTVKECFNKISTYRDEGSGN